MGNDSRRHLHPVGELPAAPPTQRWPKWKRIAFRTKDQIQRDNLSIVAAGVAFYAFLGTVPALAAFISIYGFIADPVELRNQLQDSFAALPEQARTIILDQVRRFMGDQSSLSIAAVVSVTVALWSGSKSTKALITALNIVYGIRERRNFIRFSLFGLFVTLLGVLGGVAALFLIAALPPLLESLGWGEAGRQAVNILRWPFLFIAAMTGMSAIYHYGPCEHPSKWKWFSWGSALGTTLWLAVSAGFSLYAANFASFGATYGSLGAVVVLLMWLNVSAFAILLGAEVNSEIAKDLRYQREYDFSRMGRRTMLP